jgi:DNA-binding LacI/PurR family transcriptional regulator
VFSIEHSLNDSGFEVQAHKVPHYAPHFEKRQVALVNKVRRQRPGAIISGFPLLPQTLQELESFIQEGGAVIGYGDRMKLECDQVIFDSMHRAYLAARHLLELGHREIGFCFHSAVPQGGEDFDGFSRAMAEFDAPIRKEWIFGGGNYEEGGARLAEAFINWPEKPTGLCIINDVSASTFITTLYKNGLSVPDDVSVVGFDDAPAARYALVPLTSVSYPLTAISHHVVEFTRSRLEGYHGAPRTVVVPSELVSRSSTAPYRTQSHLISNASFLAHSLPSGRLLPVS